MSTQTPSRPADASGTFALGGDLPVNRLGFGAMRLTGPGVWGEPEDPAEAVRVLRARDYVFIPRRRDITPTRLSHSEIHGSKRTAQLLDERFILQSYTDGLERCQYSDTLGADSLSAGAVKVPLLS
jgi:hypothetical protein